MGEVVVIAHATTTFRQVPRSDLHLDRVHVLGIALAVKEDEALDPVNSALLGARGMVFEADAVANMLQEHFGAGLHGFFNGLTEATAVLYWLARWPSGRPSRPPHSTFNPNYG